MVSCLPSPYIFIQLCCCCHKFNMSFKGLVSHPSPQTGRETSLPPGVYLQMLIFRFQTQDSFVMSPLSSFMWSVIMSIVPLEIYSCCPSSLFSLPPLSQVITLWLQGLLIACVLLPHSSSLTHLSCHFYAQ